MAKSHYLNMKNFLRLAFITILIFINSFIMRAQSPKYEWAIQNSCKNFFRVFSIDVDFAGNIYSTGFFADTAVFYSNSTTDTLISNGSVDCFIQKLDASGNTLWLRSFGATSFDGGHSIGVDSAGNSYTLGSFSGTVDFNPDSSTHFLTSINGPNRFILKLDPNGNFMWVNQYRFGESEGEGIDIDSDGNPIIVGTILFPVDFDADTSSYILGPVVSNAISSFILKIDSNGALNWAKVLGAALLWEGVFIESFAFNKTNDIYLTGAFSTTVDFDPGVDTFNLSTGSTREDIFILKLKSNGDFDWVRQIGGTLEDHGYHITLDEDENVITSGKFKNTVDFNPAPNGYFPVTTINFDGDVYIHKLDSSGNFKWVKHLIGNGKHYCRGLHTDEFGYIYLLGNIDGGIVDVNPGSGTQIISTFNGHDSYLLKLNSSGNYIWSGGIGGINAGLFCRDMSFDNQSSVITAGMFDNKVSFDPFAGTDSITSTNPGDQFISKISQCRTNEYFHVLNECSPYTWINGKSYTQNNFTDRYILLNAASNGCDSVVSLKLTLRHISDISTSVNGLDIKANNDSASYVWLDCDANYSIIPGDTNQILTVNRNGSFAVQITENGCVDTSDCVTIANFQTPGYSDLDFNIYPNPTFGNFIIEFANATDDIVILIYTASGQLVSEYRKTNEARIAMRLDEPVGIYLVELRYDEHYPKHVKLLKL